MTKLESCLAQLLVAPLKARRGRVSLGSVVGGGRSAWLSVTI